MGESRYISQLKTAWLGLFLIVAQLFTGTAQAATQYFSPSTGTYSAAGTFAVDVYAASSDQAASAFSGYITFPAQTLSVVSLSKNGSQISLWVQEPVFSNTAGTVSFEGLIPNPGYTGAGAKLLTIIFEVKQTGSANVAFADGSVLANDGKGTDITEALGSAMFTLGDAELLAEDDEAAGSEEYWTLRDGTFDLEPDPGYALGERIEAETRPGTVVMSGQALAERSGLTMFLDNVIGFFQAGVLGLLWLLMAFVVLIGLWAGLYAAYRRAYGGRMPFIQPQNRPRSFRVAMRRLLRDTHYNLHRLERLSRVKRLTEGDQALIRSASRALVELEDDINAALKDS